MFSDSFPCMKEKEEKVVFLIPTLFIVYSVVWPGRVCSGVEAKAIEHVRNTKYSEEAVVYFGRCQK